MFDNSTLVVANNGSFAAGRDQEINIYALPCVRCETRLVIKAGGTCNHCQREQLAENAKCALTAACFAWIVLAGMFAKLLPMLGFPASNAYECASVSIVLIIVVATWLLRQR